MDIKSFGSSSSGNCYLISDGSSKLLLECGINLKKLKEQDVKLSEVNACLITHEHLDHAKFAKDLTKYCTLIASSGTLLALGLSGNFNTRIVKEGDMFVVGSFKIIAIKVQHDAKEPLGYLIHSSITDETLLFATDTYYLANKFSGLTHIMIECNYAEDILEKNLKNGRVGKFLARRLVESHFSLQNVKKFLQENDLSKLKEIYLLHLSDGNSDEVRFKKEIQELTGVPTYVMKK